jgi:hypothetical protein
VLQVPPNAHIDFSGNDWACDEHYSRAGAVCISDLPR